jgi:hypothetical protein
MVDPDAGGVVPGGGVRKKRNSAGCLDLLDQKDIIKQLKGRMKNKV